ncbi:DUF748 domain-containing protein [Wenyingzhuangia aestuarii]|uniref:DUF748 domain-containing protein n=1 Tax=Wenyingzhuangia aestuarii TaxID=1647582 RepID=UPI001438930F|nr:DUF748 domain-containing protein [Wenyingzhuangia aestuarii]NJB82672.1 hypothetical protein [Wenyingzhuangia aestuarii]
MSREPFYKKKRIILPTLILVLLISLRIALPYLAKDYINKVLATSVPGYTGSVENVGISLYRGAYQLDGFVLKSSKANSELPFLDLPQNDISIHWKSLLHGKIVAEVALHQPKINIVKEDQEKQPATQVDEEDWTKALTRIIPIDINRLKISGGTITFAELTSDPKIDLHINKIELLATNLRNVVNGTGKLPSTLTVTGTSIGNGNLKIKGGLDLIKEIPDVDIAMEFTDIDLTAFNDFTKHYANIDFEKGNLNLYSEIVIADSYLKGYMKPLIKQTKLIGKEDSFINSLWEGFVGFVQFVFRNQSNKVVASKIPLEGDLSNVDTQVWQTVGNIVRNAWIEAFKNKVDDTIDYEEVIKESNTAK